MQTISYNVLQFTRYKNLVNLSVNNTLGKELNFNKKYNRKNIGSILFRALNPIAIQDDCCYKQITLKTYGGGAILRGIKQGNVIGTKKQFIVSTGQFIMSKIDARNGAFGIVPSCLNNAVVTSDFPVFNVKTDEVLTEYITLLSTTKPFLRFAQSCSRGTTNRQRIDVEMFLKKQIPIPSISDQESLIAKYENKINQAENKEKQANSIEQEIEIYISNMLGISKRSATRTYTSSAMVCEPSIEFVATPRPTTAPYNTYILDQSIQKEFYLLKFENFKDIHSWKYDGFEKKDNKKGILSSNSFKNEKLSNVLGVEINPKTSFPNIGTDYDISFIPMECISDEYGEWKDKRVCNVKASKGYSKFMNGDLLWARITPCMQNGKSAVVEDLRNGYGCGSTEFHILRNSNKNVNLHYVQALLRLPIVLKDAMQSFTGSAGQQRVPKRYLENLSIPLPPLEVQNEIVNHISILKQQIKNLKQQATTLRETALNEFENEIFE